MIFVAFFQHASMCGTFSCGRFTGGRWRFTRVCDRVTHRATLLHFGPKDLHFFAKALRFAPKGLQFSRTSYTALPTFLQEAVSKSARVQTTVQKQRTSQNRRARSQEIITQERNKLSRHKTENARTRACV